MSKKRADHTSTNADAADFAAELGTRNDTEHLLASPANADRLRAALRGSRTGEGTVMSVEDLRAQVGLGASGVGS